MKYFPFLSEIFLKSLLPLSCLSLGSQQANFHQYINAIRDEMGDIPHYIPVFLCQRKRMNAKFLFFSDIYLLNKIISAVFGRIC